MVQELRQQREASAVMNASGACRIHPNQNDGGRNAANQAPSVVISSATPIQI